MNKKSILFITEMMLLIIIACAFLGIGVYVAPFSTIVFYLLIIACFCCLIGAIVIFACNYKKHMAFVVQRTRDNLEKTSFSSVKYPLTTPAEIKQLLLEQGYYEDYRFALTYKRIVHKGRITCTEYFHETAFEENNIFDIEKGIAFADDVNRYYYCIIFVQNNLKENLEKLKNYIVDIAISCKTADKKFFCPLVISQGALYFLESNQVSYKYEACLKEAQRALRILL